MNKRQRARRHRRRAYRKPKPFDVNGFWAQLMAAVVRDRSVDRSQLWITTLVPPNYVEVARLHDSVVIEHIGDVVDLKPLASRSMGSL